MITSAFILRSGARCGVSVSGDARDGTISSAIIESYSKCRNYSAALAQNADVDKYQGPQTTAAEVAVTGQAVAVQT